MRSDVVDVWNVSDLRDDGIDLANRTNNALERYNRHFNGIFPSKHPSLLCFVQCLREEMDRQIRRIENVRKGREDPPVYEETTYPSIPEEYKSFWEHLRGKHEGEDEESEVVGEQSGKGGRKRGASGQKSGKTRAKRARKAKAKA